MTENACVEHEPYLTKRGIFCVNCDYQFACSVCGSKITHHVKYVLEHGKCVL